MFKFLIAVLTLLVAGCSTTYDASEITDPQVLSSARYATTRQLAYVVGNHIAKNQYTKPENDYFQIGDHTSGFAITPKYKTVLSFSIEPDASIKFVGCEPVHSWVCKADYSGASKYIVNGERVIRGPVQFIVTDDTYAFVGAKVELGYMTTSVFMALSDAKRKRADAIHAYTTQMRVEEAKKRELKEKQLQKKYAAEQAAERKRNEETQKKYAAEQKNRKERQAEADARDFEYKVAGWVGVDYCVKWAKNPINRARLSLTGNALPSEVLLDMSYNMWVNENIYNHPGYTSSRFTEMKNKYNTPEQRAKLKINGESCEKLHKDR